MATFVGHDHKNDFHGIYEGIHLYYGRVSGQRGDEDYMSGGRVIKLKEYKTKKGNIDFKMGSFVVLVNSKKEK